MGTIHKLHRGQTDILECFICKCALRRMVAPETDIKWFRSFGKSIRYYLFGYLPDRRKYSGVMPKRICSLTRELGDCILFNILIIIQNLPYYENKLIIWYPNCLDTAPRCRNFVEKLTDGRSNLCIYIVIIYSNY